MWRHKIQGWRTGLFASAEVKHATKVTIRMRMGHIEVALAIDCGPHVRQREPEITCHTTTQHNNNTISELKTMKAASSVWRAQIKVDRAEVHRSGRLGGGSRRNAGRP